MNTLRIVLAFLVGLATLACVRADDKKEDERTAHARAFITALFDKDFKAAAKDFDDVLLKALPPDKMDDLVKALTMQAGEFKKQGDARKVKSAKHEAVIVSCTFEKMPLDLHVVYDADGKIAGFFVDQPKVVHEFKATAYAKKDAFTESDVTVKTGDWAVPGTLSLPTGAGPFPAVVLVHGSGPNDRDGTIAATKVLRDLAWGLASQGVAVLAVTNAPSSCGH